MATRTITKPVTRKRKSTSRKTVDTRPSPAYDLPVVSALRTYRIGDHYTVLHIHAKDRRDALKYYRMRIAECGYLHAPAMPSVVQLVR